MTTSHNLGFPRIGPHRELKFAVEKYWRGELSADELTAAGVAVRADCRKRQVSLDKVPVGDFSWYDQVLDHSYMFGVVPPRFANDSKHPLDTYFRMARGRAPSGSDARACEMTKWFDTNYHYIVPEFSADTVFALNADGYLSLLKEAIADIGVDKVKPVLIGPLTYLRLGKGLDNPLALLPRLLPCYVDLLKSIAKLGVSWVQIDEPALVLDLDDTWAGAYTSAYGELAATGVNIMLASYFGSLGNNLDTALSLPVAGLHLDRVRGKDDLKVVQAKLGDKVLSLGVVDGRNVWRSDLAACLDELRSLQSSLGDRLWVGPSCSLLHSPVDLESEKELQPAEVKPWLAFATQKVQEIQVLKQALDGDSATAQLGENAAVLATRRSSPLTSNPEVRARCTAITTGMSNRQSPYPERIEKQHQQMDLPAFPTTTIGSFPQTPQIRQTRKQRRNGEISDADYKSFVESEIRNAVAFQEKVGLDVLVHGEAERNDMVEYFGELLSGFAFTGNGWVQSYGSRCVKPPIIYGDIARPNPMTVDWISYAQKQTSRPMKGMLTGPVTILCWSFPRDDISRRDSCRQIALALRDEVSDLETAGIGIIQMDEPAFREGLPLRRGEWQEYLQWAAECFRLSVCSVTDQTQIHTHMCYSEFNDIIGAIADMDADVITIETARSDMELLEVFQEFSYLNEIGPGVYDIHSPLVPDTGEMTRLMEKAAELIPHQRLWVNPDCGLKTRGWPETEAALVNMVKTAQQLRQRYSS